MHFDTLTEKIESFEIEGNDKEQITLYLYPLQLGRLAMISRRLIDLDLIFDDEQMEGAVKTYVDHMLRKIKRGGRNNRYRHTSDATRNRRYAKRADRTYILVPYNGYNSSYKHFVHHRISILLRGFYERYSLGKNAAGNDFPNDNSGADSHYGGRSIWACISTEGKSMLKRLTRKRKEQNI